MRAIILAAGRGSRMQGLTREHPKCLVRLAGRSLLDWQCSALRAAGIEEIAVVRGYRGEALDDLVGPTFENPRWAETNMVRSLACAEEWLRSGTCVVSYSDIVFHPEAVIGLMGAAGDLAITYDTEWWKLWGLRFDDPLSDAESFAVDGAGRLTDIGRRPVSLAEIQGQYMGLLRFTPAGWGAVERLLATLKSEEVDRLDMTNLLRRLLSRGVSIFTAPTAGRWCEVDQETDLRLYEGLMGEGESWLHDWRWENRSAEAAAVSGRCEAVGGGGR